MQQPVKELEQETELYVLLSKHLTPSELDLVAERMYPRKVSLKDLRSWLSRTKLLQPSLRLKLQSALLTFP